MLITIGYREVIVLCSIEVQVFQTKAASACPLLEIIDRVYPSKFVGLRHVN